MGSSPLAMNKTLKTHLNIFSTGPHTRLSIDYNISIFEFYITWRWWTLKTKSKKKLNFQTIIQSVFYIKNAKKNIYNNNNPISI